MIDITAKSVSVEFPMYDLHGRSLRKELLNFGRVGGDVDQRGNYVIIKALENVSFSFGAGDRVGIINHNGSGKTTLLRVLAGIYEPISGEISIKGNVSPMFDISAGMDPDATGLDNIKLRGAFLGMSPKTIDKNIEDIAEFCELGNYLQMPIRTYSAGMMVRLSFAIATCTHPEILLMDEVIGAGDAAFFERAEERLENFMARATSLFLASHSHGTIRKLCTKAILLHHGKLIGNGSVDDILLQYEELVNSGK